MQIQIKCICEKFLLSRVSDGGLFFFFFLFFSCFEPQTARGGRVQVIKVSED